MSASQVRALVEAAFRDFAVSGVPASGEHDPVKAEVRAALGAQLEATLATLGSGMLKYATTTLRDAATGVAAGAIAYVYKNAGSTGDASNGYYQYTGSVWEAATWLEDLFNLDPVEKAKANWALIALDQVTYSGISFPITATVESSNARTDADALTGFAQTYTTPAAISFNAVFLPRIARDPSAEDKWESIAVAVRTHATAPQTAGATVVAVGEIIVNSGQDQLDSLLIPLVDPDTGLPVTITQADLLAKFGVAYVAKNAGGTATAGESTGVIAGATKLVSYFVTTGFDDVEADTWFALSGNPTLSIGIAMLSDADQSTTYQGSAEMREAFGLPPYATVLGNPGPSQPIMTPRWFGMLTYAGSIFNHGLTSGLGPKLFDYSGGVGLGRQYTERWYWDPTLTEAATGDDLRVRVMDPEHLALFGEVTTNIHVVAANAAAAATRTVLLMGDSTTNAAVYSARLLANCAANAGGAQVTLLGTLGTGANKHEGRPGWTYDAYYRTFSRTDGAVLRQNPFIQTDGTKFDAAYYLSHNSIAAPAIVVMNLGINDVFACETDLEVDAAMTVAIDDAKRMIGVTADAAVGSWKESNASVKTLICTPIAPGASQTGFGDDYYIGQSYARYKRNIALAAQRIIEAFAGSEAAGIFLVPLHVTVDPLAGFDEESDPIHPITAGYNQIGDQIYYAINVLVSLGLI